MNIRELPEETIEQLREKINCFQAEDWEMDAQIDALRTQQRINRFTIKELFAKQRELILLKNQPVRKP